MVARIQGDFTMNLAAVSRCKNGLFWHRVKRYNLSGRRRKHFL